MKKFTLIILLFTCLACKKTDSANNPFAGSWSGQFSGTDSGTWTINISNNGTISGTGFSNVYAGQFEIEGRVNNAGNLLATFGTTSLDGVFNGVLTGRTGSGTWSNGSYYNGTWSGSKR